jgi:hypothetical protein
MAACVPPGGTWPSQSGGAWSSQPGYQGQPQGSAQSWDGSGDDDEYSDGDDHDDYANANANANANAPAPAARGRGRGRGGTCSSVCSRLAQCRLISFESCGELCEIAASNGHHWQVGQESCAEIKKAFVSDKWMCKAEASIGTSLGNGPWEYSAISLLGSGNTRDDAYNEAFSSCSAMATTKLNLADSQGAAVNGGTCTVVGCWPPGSSLQQ